MTNLTRTLARFPTRELPGRAEIDLDTAMRWCHTPGLSVALIDGGELRETWTAGTRTVGRAEPVTPHTRFQAGSISKSVAAAVALRLVAAGVLDLDEDVDGRLRSWRIPANDGWRPRITLRQLLSHTAGLTVHGFPGYPADASVPTVPELLDGRGNTPPVRVTTLPGVQFSYSGGGYVVLQQLLADVTATDFPTLAAELVLGPARMGDSTYAQPLPAALADEAAVGHRVGPVPVAGRWHTYPEMTAAGLWSTPADLARFFLAVRDSLAGVPGSLLPRALAEEMATPHARNTPYGLGLQLAGTDAPRTIGHGGTDEGYRNDALLYLDAGQGMVAMANSDGGGDLIAEFVRPALADEYGWPGRDTTPASPDGADRTGVYRDGDTTLRVAHTGDDVTLTVDDQPPVRLRRDPDGAWRGPALTVELRFPDPETLVLHQDAEYTTDIRAVRD
ncbi:MAG TPA: serine hydrolase domain-containing protein [Actinocatenispora sp.]